MANVKITELTAATALAGTDVLPIVDVGADATKKVSVSDLLRNLPDGTASAPALAFADDQNTGVLSPGDNSLAFATSGTQRLVINSAGQIDINSNCRIEEDGLFKASNGSAAAPSHAFLDDPDNGMFRATTNTLGFSTGGSERLRIDSSGRLLVGTSTVTTANNLFEVAHSGVAKLQFGNIGTSSNSALRISRNDTSVGGGNPLGYLEFGGNDSTNNTDTAFAWIGAEADGGHSAGNNPTRLVFATTANGASSPTERLRIDSSGRVGIGTTSAADKLHISGSNSGGFRLTNSDNSDAISVFMRGGNAVANTTDDAVLSLGQRSNVSLITTGNVGIGTASPATELHLESDSPAIRFTDSDTTDYSEIIQSGPGLFINADRGNEGDGSIIFRNGGSSERARIDSSGRLLVGHSSSTNVAAIQSQLQVVGADAGTGSIAIRRDQNVASGPLLVFGKSRGSRGGNTAVQANDIIGAVLFNAADGTDVTTSAARIKAEVDGTPGSNDMPGRLVFETTADGASSLTERMRIDSAGITNFYRTSGSTQLRIGTLDGSTFVSQENNIILYGSANNNYVLTRACNTADGTPGFEIVVGGTRSIEIESDGDIYNVNGTYGTISDARLKENIVDASSQWDDVKDLQVRNFNFTEASGLPTNTQIGFVAQEVEQVSPGLVKTNPDLDQDGNDLGTTTKAVKTSVLLIKAVKALQEAMDRIETLEAKVAALEAQ